MSNNTPLVSIITVCYNAQDSIELTVNSVLSQKCKDYEYIVIDGASKDLTVNKINKYIGDNKDLIVYSEPDNGISDAFNKGISKANGEYILFLNSGDYFISDNALELVKYSIDNSKREDVVFFSSQMGNNGKYPRDMLHGEEIWSSALLPHQSTFVRKDIFKKVGVFNNSYKIRMDYDFFARCLRANCTHKYIPEMIVYYDMNGVSAIDVDGSMREGLAIKLIYGLGVNQKDVEFLEHNIYAFGETPYNVIDFVTEHPLHDSNKYIIYGAGLRGKQLYKSFVDNNIGNVLIADTNKGGSIDWETNTYIFKAEELENNNKWIISIQNVVAFGKVYSMLLSKGVSKRNIYAYDEINHTIVTI